MSQTTQPRTTQPPEPPAPRRAPEATSARPPEELVNETASAHGFGHARRPARGHGAEQRGLAYVPVSKTYEGRFGRMFRLPPYVPSTERIAEIAALMTEQPGPTPPPNPDPADNVNIPAGFTYLGQFIDHDLTFDPASSLTRQNDPDALTDFRSPALDLDNVYGRGPADDAFMYDKLRADKQEGYLIIGHHDDEDDLPRNAQDTAIIGDPRNDENIMVSQLQLTMMRFHNAVMDTVVQDPRMQRGSETVFEAAQRNVRWHYQWVVVHDFLRRVVGADMLHRVLDESHRIPRAHLEFYAPKVARFMPVEFSVAAYRYGHSQVRGAYKLNTFLPFIATFKHESVHDNPLGQLAGFRILPPKWTIEWARFFELPEAPGADGLKQSRLIDTHVTPPMTDLPPEVASDPSSIVLRNLTRGARMALPSGQAVASAMGLVPLSHAELALPGGGPAPLWYYALKEAETTAGGRHLGEMAGRIVAEVFIGLLLMDATSYLRCDPGWRPTLRAATAGEFTMPDLIRFSGHGLEAIT